MSNLNYQSWVFRLGAPRTRYPLVVIPAAIVLAILAFWARSHDNRSDDKGSIVTARAATRCFGGRLESSLLHDVERWVHDMHEG